jgi:hypothetical protein
MSVGDLTEERCPACEAVHLRQPKETALPRRGPYTINRLG